MKKLNDILSNDYILYKAFLKSKNNRSYTMSSLSFENKVFKNLNEIKEELLNKTYEVSGYTEFKVYEPKERVILACKFRDKVVQHILCDNILMDEFEKICIIDNYSAQREKGTSFAHKRVINHMIKWYEENGMNGYIFKGDISKYYYNIDHEIAKNKMHKYFNDDVHWIIDKFIDSTNGDGLALGNQINTIISNLYLHELDTLIAEDMNYNFYGRYADDFFIFDTDKERLKKAVKKIEIYLGTINLKLNPKSQIMPFKNGLKFIGFHFYINDGKISIKIDNSKKRAYRRKFNKMLKLVKSKKIGIEKLLRSFYSWKNYASLCTDKNIFKYYERKIKEVIFDMTIEDGYYIADCTSDCLPFARKNLNTFYLPIDVAKTEDNKYTYKEYRFNIPINYEIPQEVIEYLAKELDGYRKCLEEVGVL